MVFQGGLADADDGPDLLDKGDHVLGLVVVVDELLDVLVQGLVDLLALIGVAGFEGDELEGGGGGQEGREDEDRFHVSLREIFIIIYELFCIKNAPQSHKNRTTPK